MAVRRRPVWGILSDLHLQSKDLGRIRSTLEWSLDTFEQHGVSRILCLGDVFHFRNRIQVDAMSLWAETVSRIASQGVPLHVLTGNHDLHTSSHSSTPLSTLDAYDMTHLRKDSGCFIHKELEVLELDGYSCIFSPWADDTKQLQSLLSSCVDKENTILFGHAAIQGAKYNATSSHRSGNGTLQPSLLHGLKASFFGHFHQPQILQHPRSGMYVGAPMQHHFGDADGVERGVLVCNPDELHASMQPDDIHCVPGVLFIPNPVWDSFRKLNMSSFPKEGIDVYCKTLGVEGKRVSVLNAVGNTLYFEKVRRSLLKHGAIDVTQRLSFQYPEQEVQEAQLTTKRRRLADMSEQYVNDLELLGLLPQHISSSELIAFGRNIIQACESQAQWKSTDVFNGTVSSVEMEHFLGVQDKKHVDFDHFGDGVCLLRGSNGAGKSTVFEAMTWALFGQTLRSDLLAADIVNHRTKGDCRVTVHFKNGISVERIRSSKKSRPPQLHVYQDGTLLDRFAKRDYTAGQEELDRFIGTNFNMFRTTVVFGEHNSCFKFMSASHKARRSLVEKAFHMTTFDQCLASVKADVQHCRLDLSRLRDTESRLQERMKGANMETSTLKNEAASLKDTVLEAERDMLRLGESLRLHKASIKEKQGSQKVCESCKQPIVRTNMHKFIKQYDGIAAQHSNASIRLSEATSRMKEAQKRLDDAALDSDASESELREVIEQIGHIERDLALLLFWERSFAQSEPRAVNKKAEQAWKHGSLRSYCLSEFVEHLNSTIREMLAIFGDTEACLQFTPSMRVSSMSLFGKKSSGQRQREFVCLLFALSKLSGQFSRFKHDFLFLDEIFDSLDENGQMAVLSLAMSCGKPRVWIASHSPLLLDVPSSLRVMQVQHDHKHGSVFSQG